MLTSNTCNLLGSLDFYMVVGVLLTFLQFALGVSNASLFLPIKRKKNLQTICCIQNIEVSFYLWDL